MEALTALVETPAALVETPEHFVSVRMRFVTLIFGSGASLTTMVDEPPPSCYPYAPWTLQVPIPWKLVSEDFIENTMFLVFPSGYSGSGLGPDLRSIPYPRMFWEDFPVFYEWRTERI